MASETQFQCHCFLLSIFSLITLVILTPTAWSAPDSYNKNTILCDHDFDFHNSLDQAKIQSIFDARDSFFKNYVDPTTNMLASWVIANRSQYYGISSQVLLAKMQAESSSIWFYKDMNQHIPNDAGIDMGPAVDWVLFFGWTDDGILTQFKGFYNQVDNAAKSLAEWFVNPASMGWTVGQPHPVNDGTVTPTNRATAALYIYTPWIESNELLYRVWHMIFGDTGVCPCHLYTSSLPSTPSPFTAGFGVPWNFFTTPTKNELVLQAFCSATGVTAQIHKPSSIQYHYTYTTGYQWNSSISQWQPIPTMQTAAHRERLVSRQRHRNPEPRPPLLHRLHMQFGQWRLEVRVSGAACGQGFWQLQQFQR